MSIFLVVPNYVRIADAIELVANELVKRPESIRKWRTYGGKTHGKIREPYKELDCPSA